MNQFISISDRKFILDTAIETNNIKVITHLQDYLTLEQVVEIVRRDLRKCADFVYSAYKGVELWEQIIPIQNSTAEYIIGKGRKNILKCYNELYKKNYKLLEILYIKYYIGINDIYEQIFERDITTLEYYITYRPLELTTCEKIISKHDISKLPQIFCFKSIDTFILLDKISELLEHHMSQKILNMIWKRDGAQQIWNFIYVRFNTWLLCVRRKNCGCQ